MARNMVKRVAEKFKIDVGTMAMMGTIWGAIYRLLGQKMPSARSGKRLWSPAFAIFLETLFRPYTQIGPSARR